MKRLFRGIGWVLHGVLALFMGLFGVFRRSGPIDPEQTHIDELVLEERRRVRDIVHPGGNPNIWR